jgi:hypothetical protein
MENGILNLKNTARLTGLLYFLLAIMAIYGYMYVSPKIMVAGDIAVSAKNMLANEFLFRTSLASNIITHTLFLFVALLLYRLLRQVNEQQSKIMVGLVLIGIPVAFLGGALKMTSLYIFKGELLTSFSTEQAQDIAATFLKFGSYSGQMVTFYWGLWLIPLGLLVYKSGFIPRILGILLLINGLGYMISSMTYVLFPDSYASVSKIVYPTYFLGEVPLILWLMIKGVQSKKPVA